MRWDYTGDAVRLLYRTCIAGEWGWSENERDAYTFPKYFASDGTDETDARRHARALMAAGEEHVFEVQSALDDAKRAARKLRDRDRVAHIEASIEPTEAYRETARRMGEREE